MSSRFPTLLAMVLLSLFAFAGCGTDDVSRTAPEPVTEGISDGHEQDQGEDQVEPAHQDEHSTKIPRPVRLRAGEQRMTLAMGDSYSPSPPTGVGTDDYRCFLLDPELQSDAFLTGTQVVPGNRDVVHHVILFRVPPGQVAEAQAVDEAEAGPGWTCFGGSGVDDFADVDNAQWLGAWAPGGRESVLRPGLGVELEAGSQIVMQVHYNLLAGDAPDVSSAQLRMAPPGADITPLETMLLPAPVELPCRSAHDESPLCDRATALADVKERFGQGPGATADMLYFLCGGTPQAGNRQSCTRTLSEPMTIQGVAGHMHLLGRSIKVEVNPGTDRAQTVLDIPVWDFDNQGAKPVAPVKLEAFDTVRVTCRHVQWLRDKLPSFEGQDERYVVWGEGTADEMCLGILQVTRPDNP